MNTLDRSATLTPPSAFAAVEHGESGDRLVLVEWPGGHITALTEYGKTPQALTFSDDGSRLAYRIGTCLQFYSPAAPDHALRVTDLDVQARKPFTFSSDGRHLWAATTTGLAVVDTAPVDQAANATQLVASVGAGCRIAEVVRAPSMDSLWTLCSPAPGTNAPQVLQFDAAAKQLVARLAPGASHILGFRPDGAVLYTRTVGAGDEVVALGDFGLEVVRPAMENEFILNYLPSSHLLIVAHGVEDTSDTTALMIGPLIGEMRPWLRQFPRLTDLAVTSDEQWAVFVDRASGDNLHNSGSIHISAVGSNDAKLIIATNETRSFSTPIARPLLQKPQR